ncbi:MAG: hypothetical protein UT02_C0037G0008 [Parcubacteria group bacterium GW2011_GWC2_38_7]|nr:MAG: hypothetical protein UT02_C0037G0008 [Parcubacteria group bacterium GW2011_GWC2_38_7]
MRKILSWLMVLAILFIVFLVLLNVQVALNNDNQFGQKEFVIEPGQGVRTIGKNLFDNGIIRSKFWFNVYVFIKGEKTSFYDGTFSLKTNTSIKDVINELLNQRETKEIEIKILEGWNLLDIDEYLSNQQVLKSGEFLDYCDSIKGNKLLQLSVENDWPLLREKPVNASLEGFLYPDTYRIYKQTSAEEIFHKMVDNFHLKFDQSLRDEVKKQDRDVYQILTLASIVEKEMYGYENRQKVADVFLKRLNIGMALQSDATLNYITKKGTVRPSLEDTKTDSLYNTYKYPGLPPTPICNPSIEAIRAVVYPQANPYWYFLTTPDNEIIFSKDHDEHIRNVNKYLN